MFQLLDGKGAQYDASKFQWIGSMGYSNNLVYVWHTTGVETIADAMKKPLKMAGSGTISDANIYPAILNALIGTKFEVINGYTGLPTPTSRWSAEKSMDAAAVPLRLS